MATLIPKLSIKSQDSLTVPIDIETTCRIDVIADPKEFGRRLITTASSITLMATNASYSYLYIKVMSGTNKTDYITVTIGDLFNVKIRITEFLFLPLDSSDSVKVQATGGSCKVEYGYWSRSIA